LNCAGLHAAAWPSRENVLAKPNYSFEKRQRDLEKKRKQDEKRLRKQAEKKPAGEADAVAESGSAPDDGGSGTVR